MSRIPFTGRPAEYPSQKKKPGAEPPKPADAGAKAPAAAAPKPPAGVKAPAVGPKPSVVRKPPPKASPPPAPRREAPVPAVKEVPAAPVQEEVDSPVVEDVAPAIADVTPEAASAAPAFGQPAVNESQATEVAAPIVITGPPPAPVEQVRLVKPPRPKVFKPVAKADLLPSLVLDAKPMGGEWLIAGTAALITATLLLYIPVIRGGYIWDDNYLVWDSAINAAKDGLYRIWCTRQPFDFWPVSASVFWIEWQKWGSDPFAYHVQGVLLHILNAVMVWLVLRKLSVRGAWLAASIFALHPICVATVGWIAELKTLLSTFLGLMGVWIYLDFSQRGRWWRYGAALLLFTLAILSKSSLAGLPVLILLYDWWRDGKIGWNSVKRSAPFFGIAIVASILTVLYHYYSPSRKDICVDVPVNFLAKLAGAGWGVWFYFAKTVWPSKLIMIYPHWHVPWRKPLSYVPGIALFGVMGVAWRYRGGWGKPVLIWLVGFLALMFPVLDFINMSYMMHSLVADHFQYQAMILTIALGVAMAYQLALRVPLPVRVAMAGLAAAVLVTLGVMTERRAVVVANQLPLWHDTIYRNPSAWMAYYELGTELAVQSDKLAATGQTDQANDDRYQAIDAYEKGGALQPDYPDTWSNLGVVLTRFGKFEEAAANYKKSLALRPDDPGTTFKLAEALVSAGDFDEAITWMRKTLELTKDKHPAAQLALAELLAQKKDDASLDEARKHLLAALDLQPDALPAMMDVAQIDVRQKKYDDAMHWLNVAIDKFPQSPQLRKAAGDLMTVMQKSDEAIAQYQALIKLNGADANSLSNLGYLLTQRGDVNEAILDLEQAIKLNPFHAGAFNNLGFAFEKSGQLDNAIAMYRRSLMLQNSNNSASANLERAEQKKGQE